MSSAASAASVREEFMITLIEIFGGIAFFATMVYVIVRPKSS